MRPQSSANHHPVDHPYDYGIAPPSYEKATRQPSQWNPKAWTKKTKIIAASVIAAIIVILAVVLGAVLGTRASNNSYPDYTPLTYRLEDEHSGTNFFDGFDYFNQPDPTNGFLHYVLQDAATQPAHNLTFASENSAILRVDTTSDEYDTGTGRWSVRISSKKQYNSGLFVFDVLHAPHGCATWPALWICDDSNWPDNGEIDVFESVNRASGGNQFTLHTTEGCKMNGRREQTGETLSRNCDHSVNSNEGCGVEGPDQSTGQALNDINGGTYATEWRDEGIRMWFFEHGNEPADLSGGQNASPDPSTWGEATADFPNTHCDIGNHFSNASIIINIALCGDWAGAEAVYNIEGNCPGQCSNFVANNATAFEDAYWEIRSVRVFSAE